MPLYFASSEPKDVGSGSKRTRRFGRWAAALALIPIGTLLCLFVFSFWRPLGVRVGSVGMTASVVRVSIPSFRPHFSHEGTCVAWHDGVYFRLTEDTSYYVAFIRGIDVRDSKGLVEFR